MTEQDITLFTGDLPAELAASPYYVQIGIYQGLSVAAVCRDGRLVFSHNLGGLEKPGKARVMQILGLLSGFYSYLRQNCPGFDEFCHAMPFVAEVVVFSGPMDFTVAEMREGQVSWLASLDD